MLSSKLTHTPINVFILYIKHRLLCKSLYHSALEITAEVFVPVGMRRL